MISIAKFLFFNVNIIMCFDMNSKLVQIMKDKNITIEGNNNSRINFEIEGQLIKLRKFDSKGIVSRGIDGDLCYIDIGCLKESDFADFFGFKILPTGPEQMNPEFNLFTQKNTNKSTVFTYKPTLKELMKSNFNPKYLTFIIVHGWRSGFEPWMKESKDLLLAEKSFKINVVIVDWNRGAKVKIYKQAVSNGKIAAALIALFIKTVSTIYKLSNDDFYLVGHSLGCQVVGDVGRHLSEHKLFRITALDPSGPDKANDVNKKVDSSDGQIVDVVHTDMAESMLQGLGDSNTTGHFDFYPNGGFAQPGCRPSIGIGGYFRAAIEDLDISCSHSRAHVLIRSLVKERNSCLPVGYLCESWQTFLEGRCANCNSENGCLLMGFNPNYWKNVHPISRKSERKYYFNTSGNKHYCIKHYQIAVHISNSSDSSTGRFRLTLLTKDKNFTIRRIMSDLLPGNIHTLLLTFPYKNHFLVHNIQRVAFKWERFLGTNRLQKGSTINIEFIEINYMSHILKKIRKSNSIVLCPESTDEVLIDGKSVKFIKCQNLKPNISATDLLSIKLKPMTKKEDIFSVDYELKDELFGKIENSQMDENSYPFT